MTAAVEQESLAPGSRQRFPARALAIGALFTLLFVVGEALLAWLSYRDLHDISSKALKMRGVAGEIMRLDEVLTMSANMAAATGDPTWEERYRQHEPELASALDEAERLAPELHISLASEETARANEALLKMEGQVFALLRQQKSEAALAVLASPEYRQLKAHYAENTAQTVHELNQLGLDKLEDQRLRLWWAMSLNVVAVLGLTIGWWQISQLIRRYLTATQQAEAELARINQGLEDRVRERTHELSEANTALRQQMDARAKVELELLHAQRLESLGRLAAGIAHEIDVPLQSVGDSCHFALEAVNDLHALQATYRDALREFAAGKISLAALKARMQETEEAVDIAYLDEEVPKSLDKALDDLERIGSTVSALKEFAPPTVKEQALSDLNRAVVSTLAVARNEYKDVARVSMQLGELPLVMCRIDDVNQAMLNVIVNAAQAVAEVNKGTRNKGNITVRTWAENNDALVSVEDDGPGIANEVRERMFDPFFTTKTGGRNTGQGLAMARAIVVDRHGGAITVETEIGKGTTFTLRLPVEGKKARGAKRAN